MIFITIKPGIHQQATVEFRPSSITHTPLGKLAHEAVAFINERIGALKGPSTPAEVEAEALAEVEAEALAEVEATEPFPLESEVATTTTQRTSEAVEVEVPEPVEAPKPVEVPKPIEATEAIEENKEEMEALTGTPLTDTDPVEDDSSADVAAPISEPVPVDETVEEEEPEPESGTRE